jgi:hypothetical protein
MKPLYEDFDWLSGIVLTPPDSAFESRNVTVIRAGTEPSSPSILEWLKEFFGF